MNSDFQNLSPEERDVRITALLLGELASAEAEELQRSIDANPELKRAVESRKRMLGLLRETMDGDAGIPVDAPKHLSNARREKLLARFRAAPQPVAKRKRTLWFIPMTAAAGLIGLLVVVSVDQFSRGKSKEHVAWMKAMPRPVANFWSPRKSADDGKLVELASGNTEPKRRNNTRFGIGLNRGDALDEISARAGTPPAEPPLAPKVPTQSGRPTTKPADDRRYFATDSDFVSGEAVQEKQLAENREAKPAPVELQQKIVLPDRGKDVEVALHGISSLLDKPVRLNLATRDNYADIPNPVPGTPPPPPANTPQSRSFGVEPQSGYKIEPVSKGGALVQLYDSSGVTALGVTDAEARKLERETPPVTVTPLPMGGLAGNVAPARPIRPEGNNILIGGGGIAAVEGMAGAFKADEKKSPTSAQNFNAPQLTSPVLAGSTFAESGLQNESRFKVQNPTAVNGDTTLNYAWNGAIASTNAVRSFDKVDQGSAWSFQNYDSFALESGATLQTDFGSTVQRNFFDDSVQTGKGIRDLNDGESSSFRARLGTTITSVDQPSSQSEVLSRRVPSESSSGGRGRGGQQDERNRGMIVLPGLQAQTGLDGNGRNTAAVEFENLGEMKPEDLAESVEEQVRRSDRYAGAAKPESDIGQKWTNGVILGRRPTLDFFKRSGAAGPEGQVESKAKPGIEAQRFYKLITAGRAGAIADRASPAASTSSPTPPPSVSRGEPAVAARPATPAPVPQPEVLTRENAFSTFSLNVADVSFKLAAASLEKGAMPEAANIRAEEFLNAFDYRDPVPAAGAAVAFNWERAQFPFAQNRDALRFSVKTAAAGRDGGRPLNIVLLLDASGSMERADRVRIIQEGLRTLATQLQAQDKISVVTFARTARLWVDGVSGTNAAEVARRVSEITPEGGTNLGEALDLAYATALRHYAANAINRVVLLTDGAANLGDVEPANLKAKVEANRKQGIALDCFGVGWEGFNDDLLEQLSRNGDGRYGFINSPEEAASEFAGQLAGALRVAASDVKVQVEFNPKRVNAFRQIGYAKHQLTKEQFRDNKVDAAEIGASEAGNGLYVIETNPRGDGPIATVRVRYRVPNTSDYREQEWTVPFTATTAIEQSSAQMKLAVTSSAFAEWLASSPFAAEVTSDRLLQIFAGVPDTFGADPRPKKLEWMIRQAKSISGR